MNTQSQNAHTPGPWQTEISEGRGHLCVVANGTWICGELQNEVNAIPVSEATANAKLIAAAPELLGAMRFILAFYEPNQRHLDTEAWKVAEASARRAVAKAEGRSA